MIIVTRHKALVQYLNEKGIIGKVIEHATPEIVENQDVYGVLPYSLACLCNTFHEVSMVIPAEYRGKELTVENIKSFSPKITSYKVIKTDE